MDQLSTKMMEWINKVIGTNSRIVSVSRLKGSTSSLLYSLLVENQGSQKELVLRQHNNWEWLQNEPDLVLHEVNSLNLARVGSVLTPEVIACDPAGNKSGSPAILMTKVDGQVELRPNKSSQWLDSMAETLVKIHSVDAEDFAWKYFSYNDAHQMEVPSWSSISKNDWEKLFEIAKAPRPTGHYSFIHRDYHPTNILWQDGQVSSVVDWVNACYGPKGVDVGHCRVNLALLYNVEAADTFLQAYLSHAGTNFHYNLYWDIVSVLDFINGPPEVYPGWEAFGYTGLTNEMMKERLEKYIMTLVKNESK